MYSMIDPYTKQKRAKRRHIAAEIAAFLFMLPAALILTWWIMLLIVYVALGDASVIAPDFMFDGEIAPRVYLGAILLLFFSVPLLGAADMGDE